MRKFPIILTLVLAAAWGYTSWYWYVCNIRGLCEVNTQTETTQKANMVRYDDVFTSQEDTASGELQEESTLNTILSGAISDAPKLSSDDVLSENVKKQETKQEAISEEKDNIQEPIEEVSSTGSIDEVEEIEDAQEKGISASLCESPLVGPIGLGANNNTSEVEKLEKFLSARGEDISLNGVYEQPEYEAVKRFQLEYRSDILDPWDIVEPTGYVFRTTVKKINEIACQ